ncbi:uncharacterized protein LOC144872727 [Branchiostoma floridae x Branchiostoma japonicum]
MTRCCSINNIIRIFPVVGPLTDKMMPFGNHITVCVLILTIFGPLGSTGQTCGGTLNKDSPTRNFTSPNYPGPLGDEITCEWIIEAPTGEVQLQFEVFNFPPAVFGCYRAIPVVSIYNGSSTSAPSLGQYCGDKLGNDAPPNVMLLSSTGFLLVHFSSGTTVGLTFGQGFVATFSFPDGVDDCASSPCTNGGTCVDGHGSFQCLCTSEYVGTTCQVLKSSCMLPLGMENGDIEDSQISASTEKTGYEAYKGRLNGPRAWQADVANTNQWLQVNFNTRTIITGIQTQGLWGGYVKSYRLLYGDTEDGLAIYRETGSDSDKVFSANSDGPTVVSHNLDLPTIASIVRVNPQDFTSSFIRLRMELLGCEDVITSGPTQTGTALLSTTTTSSTVLPTYTTQSVSTVSPITPPLSTPDRSTTHPAVTTASATTQPTLSPSTQSRTTEILTTSLSQTPSSVTTPNILTPSAATVQPTETSVTPSFMTPGPSTIITLTTPIEETVVTTSETFVVETSETPQVTTLEPSTVSTSTTTMEETVLTTTETFIVETSETPSVTTSTVSTSTSPMSEETVTTTTAASTATTSATMATSTTPMVETTETTTVAPTTTPVTTTDAETTKVTVSSQPTTTSLQIVESSPETTNTKTSVHTTSEAFTSRKTDMPLLVETTKPDLIKTTESLWKYTTTAKDGDKEAQTGDSGGGGGNTAVFAAAGAAGGVAVLVGVGVTVFICRRRGRNSEACGVPMHRLEENNNPKTHDTVADVEVENPLYGTVSKADGVGLAVADSCA